MIVAVLADIHANLYALEKVLEETREVCDEYWFPGDLTGYGPHAVECVARVQELEPRLWWVAGNHDLALFGGDSRGVGLDDLDELAKQTGSINRCLLEGKPGLMRWHKERSREQDAQPQERKWGHDLYVLVHGSLIDYYRSYKYIEPGQSESLRWEFKDMHARALDNGAGFDARVCLFYGHTHYPGFAWLEHGDDKANSICFHYNKLFRNCQEVPLMPGLAIINPGSIGQPRDGDARASYLLLDTERHLMQLKRVAYPVENTVEDMQRAGFSGELREFLGDWLRVGQQPPYRPAEKSEEGLTTSPIGG